MTTLHLADDGVKIVIPLFCRQPLGLKVVPVFPPVFNTAFVFPVTDKDATLWGSLGGITQKAGLSLPSFIRCSSIAWYPSSRELLRDIKITA